MENAKPYLTQYCNLVFELHSKELTYDAASENEKNLLQELRVKATEQSGLTENELTLICMCREYKIFNKVNVYAKKLKCL